MCATFWLNVILRILFHEGNDLSLKVNFAKKLLGQIVFLYFLQNKGWFGVGRDEDWGCQVLSVIPWVIVLLLFSRYFTASREQEQALKYPLPYVFMSSNCPTFADDLHIQNWKNYAYHTNSN